MSFDWQTEDDDWDKPDFESSTSDEQKVERNWRGLRWLVPLGLLFAALLVVGWVVNQRVQTATANVEMDVLASYSLVDQAVAQRDDELIQTVLSGRDEAWSVLLTEAVAQGKFADRSGLGLTSLEAANPVTPTIQMSPDLLEAEVTTVLPYAIEIGNGLTKTIELEQTAVFRLGPNRWLLSPPDIEYWGDMHGLHGQYVSIFYRDRDKEIAQDLLLSLDEKIGQMCTQLPDVDCPDTYRMTVELSTDPSAYFQMSLQAVADEAPQWLLVLPTPTLVGLPLDQAGKNALFRGYGQLVAGAVLTDLWGHDCCGDSSTLYFVILRDILQQLGLVPWPGEVGMAVSQEEFDAVLADMPSLFSSLILWGDVSNGVFLLPEARAKVLSAFAREELGISGQILVSNLADLGESRPMIGAWLKSISDSRLSDTELENSWRRFIYENSSLAQQEPPVPMPPQDIQMLCQMGDQERMAFYRHDISESVTTLTQPLNRFVDKMVALPDDDGIAFWEANVDTSLTQMFMWQDGDTVEISWDEGEDAPGSIPLHVDPSNEKLVLAPGQYEHMNYGLLDVPSCLGDACQLDTLAGYPIWSPDLEHMILLNTSSFLPHETQAFGRLILTDSLGEEIRTFAFGSSPFWLDKETFGFVSGEGEGSRHTIVTGRVEEVTRDFDVLLTFEALTAVLDDNRTRVIDFAAPQPQQPEKLVIVTTTVDEDEPSEIFPGTSDVIEKNIFVYDVRTEEIVPIQSFVVGSMASQTYRFSPNGRFLVLQQFEITASGSEIISQDILYLINLVDGTTLTKKLQPTAGNSVYWLTDFSQDGEWLVISDAHILYVIHPETGYERLVFPETDACKTAVFVHQSN